MNRKGQILIEHSIVLLVLILPLIAGILHWGGLEYQRARCARLAFLEARARLIQENRPVKVEIICRKGVTETVSLSPLRDLESPDPLSPFQGWVGRASSLWGELSRSSSSFSEQGSD